MRLPLWLVVPILILAAAFAARADTIAQPPGLVRVLMPVPIAPGGVTAKLDALLTRPAAARALPAGRAEPRCAARRRGAGDHAPGAHSAVAIGVRAPGLGRDRADAARLWPVRRSLRRRRVVCESELSRRGAAFGRRPARDHQIHGAPRLYRSDARAAGRRLGGRLCVDRGGGGATHDRACGAEFRRRPRLDRARHGVP